MLKIELHYDPVIPLQDIYVPKAGSQREISTPMVTALFIIVWPLRKRKKERKFCHLGQHG